MVQRIIIGLSGRIASGKSHVAQYLQQRYRFLILRYSDLLARMLAERNSPVNRDTLQAIGLELGRTIGYDGLTRVLLEGANVDQNYVVDGVRHLVAHEYLKRFCQDRFCLIYRDVDQVQRLRFYNARHKDDPPLTVEQFRVIDEAPVEGEIEALRVQADLILPYVADPHTLGEQVDDFMKRRFDLFRVDLRAA